MKKWMLLPLIVGACAGRGPVEGDLTCQGERSRPLAGEETTATYEVANPTDGVGFAGAVVEVFADGVVTPTCDAGCERVEADAEGRVDLTLPEGWFAYRVLGQPDTVEDARTTTLEIDAVHPPEPGGAFLNALFAESMEKIFSFSKGKVDPNLGKAVIRGVDCDEMPLKNLYPRVFDTDGFEVEPVIAFLGGREKLPTIGRRGTHEDGRSFLANLPLGEVRVELWGELDGLDALVSCDQIPTAQDTTTTGRFRPLRADAAASCL